MVINVSKFVSPGFEKGQLSSPCSLTTDLHGFILAGDESNDRISILNKDDKFLQRRRKIVNSGG